MVALIASGKAAAVFTYFPLLMFVFFWNGVVTVFRKISGLVSNVFAVGSRSARAPWATGKSSIDPFDKLAQGAHDHR
ncbi:hypothetical protein [uncultured Celeribacter sp.]|uniref:hypothetical protein n=1 Tax=uncultured Celeribacter sp. TaxID=1303376 RepID=UPI00374A5BAE